MLEALLVNNLSLRCTAETEFNDFVNKPGDHFYLIHFAETFHAFVS